MSRQVMVILSSNHLAQCNFVMRANNRFSQRTEEINYSSGALNKSNNINVFIKTIFLY